ncbi:hypothetical protein, partial [Streptomyces sp. SAS_272]|uniref:hypothetical protein n=1 Tax=Streptomyces sp. SAS_272 TaxID=3412747 RepID=UPI00403D21EB
QPACGGSPLSAGRAASQGSRRASRSLHTAATASPDVLHTLDDFTTCAARRGGGFRPGAGPSEIGAV